MPHILVVDDDEHFCLYVARLLQRRGHRVTSAQVGEDALAITRQVRPDLIVLDIELPGRTGFEICRLLNQQAESTGIPVIMMSAAKAACADCAFGLSCGAVEYIAKPFVPDIFVHLVERNLVRGNAR